MSQQPWNQQPWNQQPWNHQPGEQEPRNQEPRNEKPGSQESGAGRERHDDPEAWRTAPPPGHPGSPLAPQGPAAPGQTGSWQGWDQQPDRGAQPSWSQQPPQPESQQPWPQQQPGPQQPWPQHQPWLQQTPWSQGQQPGPAATQGDWQPPPGTWTVDDPRSRRGATALGLAVAALLVSLVFSWLTAKGYGDLMRAQGTLEIETENLPASQEGYLMVAGLGILGQLVPTALGVAGFAVALGALKLPSQKRKATAGLVLAILAPLISFTVFMALLLQTMSEIGF